MTAARGERLEIGSSIPRCMAAPVHLDLGSHRFDLGARCIVGMEERVRGAYRHGVLRGRQASCRVQWRDRPANSPDSRD